MIILTVVLLLVPVLSDSLRQIYYVKPNNSSQSCPGQPCLTFDQYTTQQSIYFTTGSSLLFLDGNHSIHATIYLSNISDISFRGEGSEFDITLLCKAEVAFHCKNVSSLTIQGLTFVI